MESLYTDCNSSNNASSFELAPGIAQNTSNQRPGGSTNHFPLSMTPLTGLRIVVESSFPDRAAPGLAARPGVIPGLG
jgi:hypothetical protein